MLLPVQKLRPDARIPTPGSARAAGCDLYACLDAPVTVAPGETVLIGTGLAIAVPEGWFAAIFARSGLATKHGLRPANCVGVIDSDYRGEYRVPLHNDSALPQTVAPGERIAQLIVLPALTLDFELRESLDETERGAGGFGSTGA